MLLHLLLFHLVLCINAVHALRKTEGQKVLLSNVQTLTLRHDLKTSHRRVAPVPQLKCIGGNAKGYYNVDIMRCKNQGADYDREDIQWTCMASLSSEFKLGSTDVICEGYESSNDPYVLKGSCGVEYRLMLTDIGEEKYGHRVKTIELVTGAIRWGGEVVQGVMEEVAMTHPLLILASLRHGAAKVFLRTQELAPLAGGQGSGQELRRALPEATLPLIRKDPTLELIELFILLDKTPEFWLRVYKQEMTQRRKTVGASSGRPSFGQQATFDLDLTQYK
ncbi:MAG: hypothetical protein L6R36_003439 [Xanthoria steineri]|nr:MAG: hypothetical protein L6R36_003439 [Xanthoria steineri]